MFAVRHCSNLSGSASYTPHPQKEATLIFDITLPSVETFLQFLKHFAHK